MKRMPFAMLVSEAALTPDVWKKSPVRQRRGTLPPATALAMPLRARLCLRRSGHAA